MAEEKKEQAKQPEEKVVEKPSEEKKALEFDGDPFAGGRIEGWMKQSGIKPEDISIARDVSPVDETAPESEIKEEEKKEEKASEKEEEKKEVTPEKEPSKEDKKEPSKDEKTKPEEKKEPYAVLEVDGKDFEVATEDEFLKLAQQGLSSTQRWQEASQMRKESEGYRQDVLDMKERIRFLENQQNNPQQQERKEEEDYSEVEPEYRDEFKKRDERINRLEQEAQQRQTVQMRADYERARADMDRNIDNAMKAHPFEEIKLDERNVSEELFAGLVTTKFNEDRMRAANDPRHQVRTLDLITKEAAQDLQAIEGFYKEKHGSSDGGEVTKEQLSEKYPDEIKSLVQEGITAYLDDKDKAPPSPKSTHGKVEATESKKEIKGIDDAFEQADKDPAVKEAIADFVRDIKRTS